MIILFPPAALAYISQDAIPGDATYPIKRGLEKGILFLSSVTPQTKALFSVSASKTRSQEIKKLLSKGDSAYDSLKELISQNDIALQEIRQINSVQDQQKYLASLAETLKQNNQELTKAYDKLMDKSAVKPVDSITNTPQSSKSPLKSTSKSNKSQGQIIQITQVVPSKSDYSQLLAYIQQLQAQQKIIEQQQNLLKSQVISQQNTNTSTHTPQPTTHNQQNSLPTPTSAPQTPSLLDLTLGWIAVSLTNPTPIPVGKTQVNVDFNIAGTGDISDASVTPAPILANANLTAPTGLSTLCQTNGTVVLIWNGVSQAGGYFLKINKEPFGDWYNQSSGDLLLSGTNTGYTFNFDSGKNYQWSVEPFVSGQSLPINNNYSSGPDFHCP